MDIDLFRDAMAQMAASVAVVTVAVGEETRGVTISSLTSLSLEPPLVLFALKQSSSMLPHLEHGSFGVTLLSSGQREIAALHATSSRPAVRPEWLTAAGAAGVRTLRGGAAALAARTWRTWRAGDHVIVVARVLGVATTGCAPLLYHRRSYHA